MAESKEELKSFLMKVKENEKSKRTRIRSGAQTAAISR